MRLIACVACMVMVWCGGVRVVQGVVVVVVIVVVMSGGGGVEAMI